MTGKIEAMVAGVAAVGAGAAVNPRFKTPDAAAAPRVAAPRKLRRVKVFLM